MKLALLALLSALSAAPAALAEGDVHTCACEAEELDFAIDCDAEGIMLDSLEFLKTNGCAVDGACAAGTDCEKNYLIVQSHHDYCPEDKIPEAIEDGFHDYDSSCTACAINRDYTVGAPDCPAAACEDGSGTAAYVAMQEAGCQKDCSAQTCKDHFLTLRVVHDSCDHDALSRAAEEGLHDMEEACKDVLCNAVDGDDKQLVCVDDHEGDDHGADDEDSHDEDSHDEDSHDDHDGHDHGDAESGAAVASAAAGLIGAVLTLLA